MVEIRSQIIELAMLARTWTAPSMIHRTYAIENNMVQIALKRNSIKLLNEFKSAIRHDSQQETRYSQ